MILRAPLILLRCPRTWRLGFTTSVCRSMTLHTSMLHWRWRIQGGRRMGPIVWGWSLYAWVQHPCRIQTLSGSSPKVCDLIVFVDIVSNFWYDDHCYNQDGASAFATPWTLSKAIHTSAFLINKEHLFQRSIATANTSRCHRSESEEVRKGFFYAAENCFYAYPVAGERFNCAQLDSGWFRSFLCLPAIETTVWKN